MNNEHKILMAALAQATPTHFIATGQSKNALDSLKELKLDLDKLMGKSSVREAMYPSRLEITEEPKSVRQAFEEQEPTIRERLGYFSLAESITKVKAKSNLKISHPSFGDRYFYRTDCGTYLTNVDSADENMHNPLTPSQVETWGFLSAEFYEYKYDIIAKASEWISSNNGIKKKKEENNAKWF